MCPRFQTSSADKLLAITADLTRDGEATKTDPPVNERAICADVVELVDTPS
ncbi:MAG: hypothetical protein L0Z68_00230 [Gammaproteobacteria bacterium]|nr:hypothetical protein [Gammaproteobacteria bacterium]